VKAARLVVALAVAVASTVHAATPADAQVDGDVADPVWWALGDSYSSGEGIPETDAGADGHGEGERDCQRASGHTVDDNQDPPRLIENDAKAWAVVAYEQTFGVDSRRENLTLTACTGTITDDWSWQVDEARRRSGVTRPDVVSFSFGGNNLNFAGILGDCIDVPLAPSDRGGGLGCDHSEDEIRRRIDALVGNSTDAMARGGTRFPAMLDSMASVVKPGGTVVVAGYPQILEETGRWSVLDRFVGCESFFLGDVSMIRSATGYLNHQLALAAQAAAARHPDVRFQWFDVSLVYENEGGRHGLCSGEPWLNGLSVSVTDGDFRGSRSFHPNKKGHLETGMALHALIVSDLGVDSLTAPVTDLTIDDVLHMEVPSLCEHPAGRLEDGEMRGISDDDGFLAVAEFGDGPRVEFGDLDGRAGADAAIQFECSHGGVGWPQPVLAVAADGSVLGVAYAHDFFAELGARDVVHEMTIEDGTLHVRWNGPITGDIMCCGTEDPEAWLEFVDGSAEVVRSSRFGAEEAAQVVLDAFNGGDSAALDGLIDPRARPAFDIMRVEGGPLTLDNCMRALDFSISTRFDHSASCSAHTPSGVYVYLDLDHRGWRDWVVADAEGYYPEGE